MSRHRNVRSLRYSDEYDGYDDVYGHSVEEDYPESPSDAAFFYDRDRQPQLSSFMRSEDIKEEDDESMAGDTEMENKLKLCLEQMKAVVGDNVSDDQLKSAIVDAGYDVQKALNLFYSRSEKPEEQEPKPQRKPIERARGDLGKKKGRKKPPLQNFNVLKFLKTKIDRNVDSFGGFAEASGPRSKKSPLLKSKMSVVGYYLCRKPIEYPSPPVVVHCQTPTDIVPFKFDVALEFPVVKKT